MFNFEARQWQLLQIFIIINLSFREEFEGSLLVVCNFDVNRIREE